MLPDSRKKASNLFALSLAGILGTSIVLALIITFIPDTWIPENNNSVGIDKYLWLFPILVMSQSIILTTSFWIVKLKKFKDASISRIVEAGADRVIGIVFGLFGAGAHGLIFSRIAGAISSLYYIFLRKNSLQSDIIPNKQDVTITEIKKVAHKYIHFPKYSIFSTLFNVTSREAPILLLAIMFSSVVTGMYALAIRVINMPMAVVGDAISRAYYQRTSELNATGQPIDKITIRLFTYMLYFGIPPIVFLICFSDQLFGLVFGSEWREAGIYTQILGITFLAMFIQRPLATLFDVFEKQKQKLVFSLSLFTFRVLSIFIGATISDSPIVAVILLSVTTFLVYTSSCFYLFHLANIAFKTIALKFVHASSRLSISLFGLPIVQYYFHSNLTHEILFSIVIFFVQYAILITTDPWLKEQAYKTSRIRGMF
jgi:O-antigen/teichoic acid export membrane protein